jgi:glycosyltransferase involved in cell wall biosynthesis
LLCKVNEDYYPPSSTLKKYVAKGYYNFMNWYAINYSSKIITVSEFARTELMAFFPKIDRNKINVIYNGVSSDFRRADPLEIEKVKLKYGIFHKYLLFVGTLNPRKNLMGLIKAFARIDAFKENVKLVVAARKTKGIQVFELYKRPDLIDG